MVSFKQNLLNIPIICFLVSFSFGWLFPRFKFNKFIDLINQWSSFYLIVAIGLKGGLAFSSCIGFDDKAIILIILATSFSILFPFLGYILLLKSTSIDKTTCAAIAAHYGSVSISTYAAATSVLADHSITYCGYIVALITLMEIPAIFTGVYLSAKDQDKKNVLDKRSLFSSFLKTSIFNNKIVLLLIGSLILGYLFHILNYHYFSDLIIGPFNIILSIFLITMGFKVATQSTSLKKFNFALVMFGFYMPIIGSFIGLVMSWLIKLDLGTGFLFTVLCSSASYIVVPAALRIMLPKAQESIYLPMSLAITFPFNILFGIPLYFALCVKFLK
ncbi:MAG: hypothetical protein BGO77_03505 [Caedibacter sp. 37-49]|nr:MAG: hypothetical protein BGO77_03505 [Caedibacter sp. 37-49]